MGSGGNAAGSGATPAGTSACSYGASVHRGQAGRSAGPSAARAPEAARRALHVQPEEIVTESNWPPSGNCTDRQPGKPCPCTWNFLCALSRRRHVSAAEIPAYQALSTDDFRQPPLGMPGTRTVGLAAATQNRLFWRTETG